MNTLFRPTACRCIHCEGSQLGRASVRSLLVSIRVAFLLAVARRRRAAHCIVRATVWLWGQRRLRGRTVNVRRLSWQRCRPKGRVIPAASVRRVSSSVDAGGGRRRVLKGRALQRGAASLGLEEGNSFLCSAVFRLIVWKVKVIEPGFAPPSLEGTGSVSPRPELFQKVCGGNVWSGIVSTKVPNVIDLYSFYEQCVCISIQCNNCIPRYT